MGDATDVIYNEYLETIRELNKCPKCGGTNLFFQETHYGSLEFNITCLDCGWNNKDKILNDQQVKSDNGKPKLTLVPRQIIFDIAKVREYGNNKYPDGGPDNWKQVDIQRYKDALYRHFMAYLDDPDGVDEESGIPHYMHMACNMAFICELEKGAK